MLLFAVQQIPRNTSGGASPKKEPEGADQADKDEHAANCL